KINNFKLYIVNLYGLYILFSAVSVDDAEYPNLTRGVEGITRVRSAIHVLAVVEGWDPVITRIMYDIGNHKRFSIWNHGESSPGQALFTIHKDTKMKTGEIEGNNV